MILPEDNSRPSLTDIRKPDVAPEETHAPSPRVDAMQRFFAAPLRSATDGQAKPRKAGKRRSRAFLKPLFIVVVFFLLLGGGFLFFKLYSLAQSLAALAKNGEIAFEGAFADLKLFKPSMAEDKLVSVSRELSETKSNNNILQSIFPLLRTTQDLFTNFQALTSHSILLTKELTTIQNEVPDVLFNHKGDVFVASIDEVRGLLHAIQTESLTVASTSKQFGAFAPRGAVLAPFTPDLDRFAHFLDALVPWLQDGHRHHIAILLQNPSEIRPGGGFLGSYADLVIASGSIVSVEPHDINDPDRALTVKTVPPQQLQLIVSRWRAADANWFFDFSDSASHVLQFMELSDYYKKDGTFFDGAIAVSPRVVSDLLGLTGPIELKNEHITVTSENFLPTIQKQVQLGQATRSTYPKKVLQELAMLMLQKVEALSTPDREKVLTLLQNWLGRKEIMVYFKNVEFEKFFSYYGATGGVYPLPSTYEGDYLALVSANIGGGKTDLYMKENLLFQSQLNEDGVVSNHVLLERTHTGNAAKEWWYKQVNQEYIKLFTPPMVQLANVSGGRDVHVPAAPLEYRSYLIDPLVQEVEFSKSSFFNYPALSSFTEYGKNVFATWSRVQAGATSTLVWDYTMRLSSLPTNGMQYQFVFEKQAGTNRDYQFELSAPVGFRWKENSLPIYEYKTSDPPGRLILRLTLEKAPQ